MVLQEIIERGGEEKKNISVMDEVASPTVESVTKGM